jgi:hypothetical protein
MYLPPPELGIERHRDGLEPEHERLHIEETVTDVVLYVRHYFAGGFREGPRPGVHVVEILGPLDGRIEAENRVDVLSVPPSHLLRHEHTTGAKDPHDLSHCRRRVTVQHHVEESVGEAKMPCVHRLLSGRARPRSATTSLCLTDQRILIYTPIK